MFRSGNCGEKSLSWILNILKFPSFYSGNFKVLKNALRQIIPNRSTNHAITTTNSYKWLPMIRTSIFWTLLYFELSFLSLRVFSLVNSNSELVWLELRWKKIVHTGSRPGGTSNPTSNNKSNILTTSTLFIFIRQKPTSDIRHGYHFCSEVQMFVFSYWIPNFGASTAIYAQINLQKSSTKLSRFFSKQKQNKK